MGKRTLQHTLDSLREPRGRFFFFVSFLFPSLLRSTFPPPLVHLPVYIKTKKKEEKKNLFREPLQHALVPISPGSSFPSFPAGLLLWNVLRCLEGKAKKKKYIYKKKKKKKWAEFRSRIDRMLLIPFVYRDTHGLHAGICVIESHEVERKKNHVFCLLHSQVWNVSAHDIL